MTDRRPRLLRMCRVCKTNQYLNSNGVFYQHACDGGGRTPGEVEDIVRTFYDWEHVTRENDQPNWRRTVRVVDHADSIGLNTKIEIRTGTASGAQWFDVAVVDVRIRPEDTRALIAELTAIAELRGL